MVAKLSLNEVYILHKRPINEIFVGIKKFNMLCYNFLLPHRLTIVRLYAGMDTKAVITSQKLMKKVSS